MSEEQVAEVLADMFYCPPCDMGFHGIWGDDFMYEHGECEDCENRTDKECWRRFIKLWREERL